MGPATANGWIELPPDKTGAPLITGYLTSDGTNHKIKWSSAATSSDDVGTRAPPTDQEVQTFLAARHAEDPYGYCLGTIHEDVGTPWPANQDPFAQGWHEPCSPIYGQAQGAIEEPAPFEDVFVSDPVEQRMVIDVHRGFNLLLYLKKNPANAPHTPCTEDYDVQPTSGHEWANASWVEPSMDVSLWVDDHPIGGEYHHAGYKVGTGATGYGQCPYRMQSELLVLEKGTILKLKIRHVLEQYHYAYGLSGDHRSALYIWGVPGKELVYRYPELLAGGAPADPDVGTAPAEPVCDGTSGTGGTTTNGGSGMGLGLAAVGLTPSARRRAKGRWAVVLVIAALALGGCLSSGGGGPGPGASNTSPSAGLTNEFIDDPCQEVAVGGRGAIVGQVHDDLHIAIEGVHVTLSGYPDFAETDRQGRFSFLNVTPGNYKVRFDHDLYKTLEDTVPVKAAKVSKPDVTLELRIAKIADLRPHNHDYWNGKTDYDLESFAVSPTCVGTPATCSPPAFQFSAKASSDPNRVDTIIPGTGRITIKVTWDATKLHIDRFGLNAGRPQGASMSLPPRASGIPFEVQTPSDISDGMADLGHTLESTVYFALVQPLDERLTRQEREAASVPGYDWGTITVEIKIHKGGPMPLGEPHPDYWATETRLSVIERGREPIEFQTLVEDPSGFGWIPGAPPCDVAPAGPCGPALYPVFTNPWDIVPPGTKWLEVLAYLTREGTPQPYLIDEAYYKDVKTGLSASDAQTLVGYKPATPYGGAATWSASKFKIPVADDQTDEYYAGGTAWTFTVRLDDELAAWADVSNPNYCIELCQFLNLEVWAHSDPMP